MCSAGINSWLGGVFTFVLEMEELVDGMCMVMYICADLNKCT